MTVITAKLPAELHEKARKKSEETGVSISFVVRKAIEAWVGDVKDLPKKEVAAAQSLWRPKP